MRCKKCGFISFDWLDNCKKCGKSLSEEKQLIGIFFNDEKEINWFSLDSVQPREDNGKSVDISNIDVSDIVENDAHSENIIEENELAQIANNEDFQKALEEIAK